MAPDMLVPVFLGRLALCWGTLSLCPWGAWPFWAPFLQTSGLVISPTVISVNFNKTIHVSFQGSVGQAVLRLWGLPSRLCV